MHSLIVYPLYSPLPDFDRRLEAIAQETSLSLFDLRQALIGVAPTILRRSDDEAKLRALAGAVRRAGLAAVFIPEQEPGGVRSPERASSLSVEDRATVFTGPQGKRFVVPAGEPLFLVIGALRPEGGNALRTSRASMSEVRAPDGSRRLARIVHDYPVMDIYLAKSGQACRVTTEGFNFSGLSRARKDSAALNFTALIDLLRSRASHCVEELGFGLSTIPGCTPDEQGGSGSVEANLTAFTRYSRLMYLCFDAGLHAAAGEYDALYGSGAQEGGPGSDQQRPGGAARLPAPPVGLSVRGSGLRAAGQMVGQAAVSLLSWGPSWLLVPLLCFSFLAALAGAMLERLAPVALGGLVFGFVLLLRGVELGIRKRLIENTPTSRVRSLAMGFVEIIGKARRKYALKVPYLLVDCVYYRYSISEQRRSTHGERWVVIERGDSGPVPFYIEDETGRVLVDPRGGVVEAVVRQNISGEAALRLGGMMMSPHHKMLVEYIPDGFTTYLCGYARPVSADPHHATALLNRRLRQLKRSPERLSGYDADGDGRIDQTEWDRARADMQRQVDAERLLGASAGDGEAGADEAAGPDEHGEQVVIGAGGRAGRFYIRGENEISVVKNLKLNMLMNIAAGAVIFIVCLVYLMRMAAGG